MKRKDVFAAINGERNYQDSMADRNDSHVVPNISMGDTLAAIEHNVVLARTAWYSSQNRDHPAAMAYLRKVAALVVQFGEGHGIPTRAEFE